MLTPIRSVLEHAGVAPQTVDVLAPVVVVPPPSSIDVAERHGVSEVQLALRAPRSEVVVSAAYLGILFSFLPSPCIISRAHTSNKG